VPQFFLNALIAGLLAVSVATVSTPSSREIENRPASPTIATDSFDVSPSEGQSCAALQSAIEPAAASSSRPPCPCVEQCNRDFDTCMHGSNKPTCYRRLRLCLHHCGNVC
jgi:hypothetical protein